MYGTGFARRPAAALLVATLGLAAGCGGGGKPAATVSGTVAYKGTPLTGGEVNFLGKNGAAAVAKIDSAGAFKIDGSLDADDYKVYFSSPPPEPVAPGTKVGKAKADLPPKFKDPASSGVVVPVKAGANVIPVEFKD